MKVQGVRRFCLCDCSTCRQNRGVTGLYQETSCFRVWGLIFSKEVPSQTLEMYGIADVVMGVPSRHDIVEM